MKKVKLYLVCNQQFHEVQSSSSNPRIMYIEDVEISLKSSEVHVFVIFTNEKMQNTFKIFKCGQKRQDCIIMIFSN